MLSVRQRCAEAAAALELERLRPPTLSASEAGRRRLRDLAAEVRRLEARELLDAVAPPAGRQRR